jgi:inhibitor of cysteine peptidase
MMNAKILALIFGLMLTALLFGGCQSTKEVVIDENSDGKTVEMGADQVLFVQLKSNPTTGYSWGVEACDEAILSQQGDPEFVTSSRGEKLTGAGGWEVFQFKPAKAGETQLKLIYRRPWEKDVEPIQTFTVSITVK